MECCIVNGLDKAFGEKQARRDVEAYTNDGLDSAAQEIVDLLKARNLAGNTLLEIGCGVGSLILELLKAGLERAMGVDVSPANVQAANNLAEKKQMGGKAEYRILDFAQRHADLSPADIVVMHRVICCYPKMVELVVPAAQHARRFLALTYPRDVWWIRLRIWLENIFYLLTRQEYRAFLHPPAEIQETVINQGFSLALERISGEWHVNIFHRQGPGEGLAWIAAQ